MKKLLIGRWFLCAAALTLLCLACSKEKTASEKAATAKTAVAKEICVFVPGMVAGSPTYEMMVNGVKNASYARGDVTVTVVEAGFNQAEWGKKLTSLAATKRYTLIVSSNPSLPEIVREVNTAFPKQRFFLMDGELSGLPSVYALRFKTEEMAFLAGSFAALLTQKTATRDEKGGVHAKAIGLLAAQEYPVMNNLILPYYERGAQSIDASFMVDFRVLGNWFDAEKARSLASDMLRSGSGVILPIAGSANEGVVEAARSGGGKIVWFDDDGSSIRPGTIMGSAVIKQDDAARDKMALFFDGKMPFGTTETVGVREGYIDFVSAADCDAEIVKKMKNLAAELAL